jgi:adenylyl- and sulfurtransferase ThiI
VHPVLYGDNVHLSVKRTPEFQSHMTPQNARKTRSFKIRKRRIAHSFPLTAFKINISIIFMHYNTSVKCLTNIKGKECFILYGNERIGTRR